MLTLEQFKEKYYSMKTKDLAKELGVSIPTLLRTVHQYGLEPKKPGFNSKGRAKIQLIKED